MSYNYKEIKPSLFEESAQKTFLEIRDKAKELLSKAGAFRLEKCLVSGSTWIGMACLDRLVELGELREIPTNGAAQERIFVEQ